MSFAPEQQELVDALLQWRNYNTVLTRYLNDTWLRQDKIHSYMKVAYANTGRPSYSDPNIANIPKDLRFIIQSTHEDGQLVTYDRQGSEYRVAAYLSGHTGLIKSFQEGRDIHTFASELTGAPRTPCKTLNFQYLYWGTPEATVQLLTNMGVENAKEVYIKYDKEMNLIRKWQEELVRKSQRKGYVESPSGRRGYRLRPTSIVNYPFQSYSSDLNKATLLHFFNNMQKRGLKSHIWCEFYDGTEIDVAPGELEEIREIAKDAFTTVIDINNTGINVPFPLEEELHGRFWGEMPSEHTSS